MRSIGPYIVCTVWLHSFYSMGFKFPSLVLKSILRLTNSQNDLVSITYEPKQQDLSSTPFFIESSSNIIDDLNKDSSFTNNSTGTDTKMFLFREFISRVQKQSLDAALLNVNQFASSNQLKVATSVKEFAYKQQQLIESLFSKLPVTSDINATSYLNDFASKQQNLIESIMSSRTLTDSETSIFLKEFSLKQQQFLESIFSTKGFQETNITSSLLKDFITKQQQSIESLFSVNALQVESNATIFLKEFITITQKQAISSQRRYLPRAKPGLPTNITTVTDTADGQLFSMIPTAELIPFIVTLLLGSSFSFVFGSYTPIESLFSLESLFVIYCGVITQFWLQHPVEMQGWKYDKDWSVIWDSCMTSVPDTKEWFRSWFLEDTLTFEEIPREDAEEFLSWAMYGSIFSKLTVDQIEKVEQSVGQIETFTNHKFPHRKENALPLKSMRSTIEPLRFIHKPLLFYLVTQGLFGAGLAIEMKKYGFQENNFEDFRYFILKRKVIDEGQGDVDIEFSLDPTVESESDDSKSMSEDLLKVTDTEPVLFRGLTDEIKALRVELGWMDQEAADDKLKKSQENTPIVFFHGIGGLPSYVPLLKEMSQFNRDVIAVELPYVSLHISPNVPSIDAHVDLFHEILATHGYEKAIVIGHSYGTNVISWLVKAAPEKIQSAVFLDPVCFLLHLKDVTYNWFYKDKSEREKELPLVSMENIASLVKTELFVVHTLQRPLVWFRNALWPRELQEANIKSLVIVSSDDHIVPSEAVERHINEHIQKQSDVGEASCMSIQSLAGSDHGGLVFNEAYRKEAIQMIGDIIIKTS